MKWTFDSDQELQSYPINYFISLIPERMWHDIALFNQTLSDVTLQLMSTEISELETLAAEEYLHEGMTAQEMQCTFLAIALSHPDASDEALLRIAETMQIPRQYLYTCVARLGRIGLMEPALSNAAREVSTQIHPSESALNNLQKIMTLAVTYGHIKVVDHVADLAPNCLEPIIRMNHYEVFKASACSGQLPVMQRLMQLAQPSIKHLIRQGAYAEAMMETLLTVYRFTFNQIVIKALNWFYPDWLKAVLHEHVKTMLHDDNDRALIQVAETGYLDVLQGLFERYTPSYQGIAYAFMNAAAKGHNDIAHWLLSHPYGFNIADCQDSVYGVEYVHPFIIEKLDELKYRQQQAVLNNEAFNLNNHDEKLLCIYMARNLIRRNQPDFLEDIRFLLTIPSVNAIAHTHSTCEPNHLLRLAMTIENQEAIDFLLTIPAIAQLAQQHDYYRAERRNGLDADVMVHDRESSLRALGSGERERLARATAHYVPKMRELGIPAIISQLKQLLASRYHSNPAILVRDDHRTITLPIDWHQFQALALTAGEQQRVLVAYYQNKNHTALRFLSKPNPWIHPQAPFVMTSERGQWASFEAYQDLICLFFLAACDERYAPGDSAIEHFVDELAHINRAHNWDNTRQNGDNTEEYDDLIGDKPSCFSGMKRRLFQSVPGHPLLMTLTRDMINLELGDFIRGHCQAMLNGTQGEVFRKAWQGYVAEPNPDDLATLKALDVSAEQHQAFLDALTLKYREQFSDEPQFVNQVNRSLALPPENEAQVINCSGLARIATLFEIASNNTSSSLIKYGLFHQTNHQDGVQEIKEINRCSI